MPSKGSVRVGVSAPRPDKKKARISNGKHARPAKPIVRRVPALPPKPASKPNASTEPADLASPSTSQPCKSFMIIAGSYEKLLYGLEGTFPPEASTSTSTSAPVPSLKPAFIFPAHIGSVRAIAASPDGGKWLATGSTDEIIKVWNLKRRKEVGGLVQHEGSITHLSFPTRNTLVSASEDGTLALFRVRGWELLRSLKGHTGRVNSVAVHPSGKVALSVGKDRTLRMWDLVRGKGVASVKLGKEGEVVRWNNGGKRFVVQAGKEVDVYSTEMKVLSGVEHGSRVHDVRFCVLPVSEMKSEGASEGQGEEVLLVTGEDGKVAIYALPEQEGQARVLAYLVGHQNRVKAVDTIHVLLPSSAASASERKTTVYAVTVSSDGLINLYDLASVPAPSSSSPIASSGGLEAGRAAGNGTEAEAEAEAEADKEGGKEPVEIQPITSYDTKGTRLTCVAFAQGEMEGDEAGPAGAKRKRDEGAEDEETDVEEASESDEEEEEGQELEQKQEEEEEEEEFGGFDEEAE